MPRRWSSAFRLSGRDLLEQAEASLFPRRSGFLRRWHSLTLRMIQLRSETRSLCALCGLLFKFIAVLLLPALKIIQRTGNLSPHRLGHMRADQRETASHSSPPMVAGNRSPSFAHRYAPSSSWMLRISVPFRIRYFFRFARKASSGPSSSFSTSSSVSAACVIFSCISGNFARTLRKIQLKILPNIK